MTDRFHLSPVANDDGLHAEEDGPTVDGSRHHGDVVGHSEATHERLQLNLQHRLLRLK